MGVVVVNKVLTGLAAGVMWQIGWRFGGRELGMAAAVLFLFNPASVFYHSVYSEPIFAFLTMLAIKYALDKQKQSNSLIE